MSDCDTYQVLMMGLLDGELTSAQEDALREHIKGCSTCAAELTKYQNLQRIAASVRLSEPTDREWERFWAGFYNRLERQSGWLFVVLGTLLLVVYGAIELVREPGIHVVLRVGLASLALGFILLFLSVLRGRLRLLRYDPYRGVRR
jgi:predicted anti-sigma-YlaC factor YlaD